MRTNTNTKMAVTMLQWIGPGCFGLRPQAVGAPPQMTSNQLTVTKEELRQAGVHQAGPLQATAAAPAVHSPSELVRSDLASSAAAAGL